MYFETGSCQQTECQQKAYRFNQNKLLTMHFPFLILQPLINPLENERTEKSWLAHAAYFASHGLDWNKALTNKSSNGGLCCESCKINKNNANRLCIIGLFTLLCSLPVSKAL